MFVVCFTLVLLGTGAFAWAQSAARDPFSADELSRLRKGQLVVRPSPEKRGDQSLLGGASWQLVKRPADIVWRAVLDTHYYHKMIPTVTSAKSVASREGKRVVQLEHKAGPIAVRYNVSMHVYPDRHDITFALAPKQSSGPRSAWGFISVRPYGPQQTLIAYGVMADPGDGLLITFLRGTVQEWILRVPEQMRKFIESDTARALYAEKR